MTDELTELDLMNDPMPEKKKPSGCDCFDGTCDEDDCLCACDCKICEPGSYHDEEESDNEMSEEEFYEMEFKERHQKPKSLFEFIPSWFSPEERMEQMVWGVIEEVKIVNGFHKRLADLKEEIQEKDKTDDNWCMPRDYYTKTFEARDNRSFKTNINNHTTLLIEMQEGLLKYSKEHGFPIPDIIPEVVDPLDAPYVIGSVASPEVFKEKDKIDKRRGDAEWEARKGSGTNRPDSNLISAWKALLILATFGFFGFLIFMGLNW